MDKTYYLFGEDAIRVLEEEGTEALKKAIEEGICFSTLIFIEGETHSSELAEEMNGYLDYKIIDQETHNSIYS